MTYDNILLDIADNVATITLNRPETRNALSWALAAELSDALDRLGDARALLLTGAGAGFCSGGDLSSKPAEGLTFGDAVSNGLGNQINPMVMKLRQLDIPVVAAVHGAVAGAGVPLALMADFVIASESAYFYLAFANVGLVPDAGASWLLPRLIGHARSMQMMMLADRIPAQQAAEWGLIYKCVADDALLSDAQALARRLASGPTVSYGLIRRNALAALDCDLATALANEAATQRIAGNSADCAEAVAAFMAKRPPKFTGR